MPISAYGLGIVLGFQVQIKTVSARHGFSLSGCQLSVSLSPTKVVVSCVLPHQRRALWDEPTATVETGVLQLQVRSGGTAFQLNCDKLTLAFNDLSGY